MPTSRPRRHDDATDEAVAALRAAVGRAPTRGSRRTGGTRDRGRRVLLAGASGTGKTLAAVVVARDLGRDLHVVDVSRLLGTGDGAVRDRLDEVLRRAEDADAVLFFDEADALFGKRGDVRDAHDRYANLEVSHLLDRLARHVGVVVLAADVSTTTDHVSTVVDAVVDTRARTPRTDGGMGP